MRTHVCATIIIESLLAGGEIIARKATREHLQFLRPAVGLASICAPHRHHGIHHQLVTYPSTVGLSLILSSVKLTL